MLNASFRCNANESENAIRAASGGRLRKNSVTGGVIVLQFDPITLIRVSGFCPSEYVGKLC